MWTKVLPPMLFLFLLFAPSIGSASLETSLNIFSSGTINYSTTQIIFSDDFSETEIVNGKLSGWPSHWVSRPDNTSFSTESYHSGGRSLTITYGGKTDYDRPNRPNVHVVMDSDPFSPYNDFWMSSWYYFPDDFTTNSWFVYVEPAVEYSSDMKIHPWTSQLEVYPSLDQKFVIWTEIDGVRKTAFEMVLPKKVPLGQWFNIKFHFVRDSINGILEGWQDGERLFEYKGPTKLGEPHGSDFWHYVPFDHYCAEGNPVTTLYFDDIEIITK